MGPPRCLEDDSGCIVLHTLQLLDAADWRVAEFRVGVVQSREDQTVGHGETELCVVGVLVEMNTVTHDDVGRRTAVECEQ